LATTIARDGYISQLHGHYAWPCLAIGEHRVSGVVENTQASLKAEPIHFEGFSQSSEYRNHRISR